MLKIYAPRARFNCSTKGMYPWREISFSSFFVGINRPSRYILLCRPAVLRFLTFWPTIFQSSFVRFLRKPHSLNFFSYCVFLDKYQVKSYIIQKCMRYRLRCFESMSSFHKLYHAIRSFEWMSIDKVLFADYVLESVPALGFLGIGTMRHDEYSTAEV